MRLMPAVAVAAALGLAALLPAGCGDPVTPAPTVGGHEHVHVAPHGGLLVVLEEEALNLELLADVATGRLTAWALDGHAERPVRLTQASIELTIVVGGTAGTMRLDAVANPLTGETKGDTSQFEGTSDSLRGAGEFSGVVRSVGVGDRAFAGVPFRYAVPRR